ncbi:MAG: GlxA family transcriptional regulator [Pseudomonadota bacterium]
MNIHPGDTNQTIHPVETRHTIGFMLAPNFSMISVASAIEVLRLANHVTARDIFDWKVFSLDGADVPASNGIRISCDGPFSAAEPMPEIVLCTPLHVDRAYLQTMISRVRTLAARGAAVGSVCSGTYVLARAGLLDGYRCAIHWEHYDAFREEFPEIEVTQNLFEVDRNRFTCAGGTAAADMMLTKVTDRLGSEVAAAVTDELIHHRMRDADERQRMELRSRVGVAHPKLLSVIGEMENRIERPLTCSHLARLVHLSPRQLERLFQRYLNSTPTRYYLTLRLNRARHLLRQTSMPILSVGLACGFVSASHFSKCYSEHFKRTPSEERKKVIVAA